MKSIITPVEQLGRVYHFHHRENIVNDPDSYMYHHHTFCEIYLLCDGDVEFIIEGSTHPIEKNDIIIIPPYKFHSPKPKLGRCFERIVINVFPSFFYEMSCIDYMNIFSRFENVGYHIKNNIGKAYMLQDTIYSIKQTFNNNYEQSNILPNLKIVELMYNLYRLLESNELESQKTEISANDPIISSIIQYINKNYTIITNIDSVSSVFNYSPNYLSKIFKQSTGTTIPKYVNIKRFENIEKLYRTGISLEAASKASGFNNYRHFAYAYKQEYGISPKTGMKF